MILVFFGLLCCSVLSKTFYNYGYLEKDGSKYCGNDGAIYINTTEFDGDKNVYLKIEVTDGYFKEDYLYYGGYSTIPYQVNLENTKDNYYKSTKIKKNAYYSDYYWKDSKDEITYFKVKIPKEKYLFISVPNYLTVGGSLTISFGSTLTVGEIVGIGLAGIVAFTLIVVGILLLCRRRKMKLANNNIETTNGAQSKLI